MQEQFDQIPAIRERAYFLWEQAGRPEGCEDEFWLEAERQLKPDLDFGGEVNPGLTLDDRTV